MHVREEGLSQQAISPVRSVLGAEHQVRLDLIPWDTRSVTDLDARDRGAPELELWMRTPPAEQELAAALTAYATDLTVIGTALRAVDGVSQRDAGTAFTSAVTSSWPPTRRRPWSASRRYGAGTSMTTAEPIPPPAHIAATPRPPPRRRSSCTSVTSIRAPVAATGWPSEQPLPFTFTRS
jgi:hypothetical protein